MDCSFAAPDIECECVGDVDVALEVLGVEALCHPETDGGECSVTLANGKFEVLIFENSDGIGEQFDGHGAEDGCRVFVSDGFEQFEIFEECAVYFGERGECVDMMVGVEFTGAELCEGFVFEVQAKWRDVFLANGHAGGGAMAAKFFKKLLCFGECVDHVEFGTASCGGAADSVFVDCD